MRIWSLHPRYLDRKGLLAAWREALLARAVLHGLTKGYKHHPQLLRFRTSKDPFAAINYYLHVIYDEALVRGYKFDQSKLHIERQNEKIPLTIGQLNHEWHHLLHKLSKRDPALHEEHLSISRPLSHPLFFLVPGEIESWEKLSKN